MALLPYLRAGHPPPLTPYDTDIIILTLDREAETMAAVQSALRQTGLAFHVTVLDQGSKPAISDRFTKSFADLPGLGYFSVAKNLGVAGGRNLAAAIGSGRIIIALDNDAEFENQTVAARAVHAFDETPELAALGFKILERDGIHLDEFSWGYPAQLKSRFNDRFDATTFVGAGHAIRRTAWEQVGGYDETLFFTWEEYDFCLAAIALGWLIRYDGSYCVTHKVSREARIGWNAARTEYFIRNRLLIARKWGASWPALLPRITAYLLKAFVTGRLAPAWRGVCRAISQHPRVMARKMTPEMRRYIVKNELRYRGSWFGRIRFELFGRINRDIN